MKTIPNRWPKIQHVSTISKDHSINWHPMMNHILLKYTYRLVVLLPRTALHISRSCKIVSTLIKRHEIQFEAKITRIATVDARLVKHMIASATETGRQLKLKASGLIAGKG